MNNGLYEHLVVFVAIARAGSLTGASINTGINQTTISRQLLALEKHLGCRLFNRSTRAIHLTEDGETFLGHALTTIEQMKEAEACVQRTGAQLRGRLRVSCSNGFGRKLLIPALAEWRQQHPKVKVELLLSDQVSQVIEAGADVAFRIAELAESGLVARPVGTFQRIVVASPRYLQHSPPIQLPQHLERQECILFTGMEHPGIWQFSAAGEIIEARVHGTLALSSMDALYEAVLSGLGVAVMPDWFWTQEIRNGQVVRLLEDFQLPERTIHAVTASRQPGNGKVQAFVSFMERKLAALSQHRA